MIKSAQADPAAWKIFLLGFNGSTLMLTGIWENSNTLQLVTDCKKSTINVIRIINLIFYNIYFGVFTVAGNHRFPIPIYLRVIDMFKKTTLHSGHVIMFLTLGHVWVPLSGYSISCERNV